MISSYISFGYFSYLIDGIKDCKLCICDLNACTTCGLFHCFSPFFYLFIALKIFGIKTLKCCLRCVVSVKASLGARTIYTNFYDVSV